MPNHKAKPSKQVDKLERILLDNFTWTRFTGEKNYAGSKIVSQTKINDAIKAIRAYYKGLVPEEKEGKHIPFTPGGYSTGLTLEDLGYNQAIKDMIKRIEKS